MARVTPAQQNFSGGEVSKSLEGRFDLAAYYNSAAWLQNFIPTVQGMARFRSGSRFVWNSRNNGASRLVPFEYNTEQAYILEFSDLKIRIIKDGGLVTDTGASITGITAANPAVVTYAGADIFANGDRVTITGVSGMLEINNQEYIVANLNAGANTFELQGVDSTLYTAYTSGGTVSEIIEITTPYSEAQLFDLDFAQTNDTLYIVHPSHQPRKLTRSSHTVWTLSDYAMTANPFITKAASQNINGITQASPAVVTYAGADTYANGDYIWITGVTGMTQVNNQVFIVAGVDTGANTFQLTRIDGTNVDSSAYTAYAANGTVEEITAQSWPSKIAFFEQRLILAASDSFPQRLWFSKGGEYDNFTTGTSADDALIYNIASGQANRIRWMVGTEEFLAIGTAGAEFKAEGGNDSPITPTNISIKPPSYYGSANIKPIRLDSHVLYIQRDQITTRTFEFDALQDGYTSINRNLTADEILKGRYGKTSGAKQVAFQSGSPSINWVVRNDGILCSLTFEPREQVNGWARHLLGGSLASGKQRKPEAESVASIPQATGADQVYVLVKRTVGGNTVRHIEYFSDQPNIPRRNDYFTDIDSQDDDTQDFEQDLWEAQKRMWYLDSALAFDGTVEESLVLTATTGAGVTATAGGAVFSAGDEGREIWAKSGGRAEITAYVNGTTVTVTVLEDFETTGYDASDWYLTNDTFDGLQHLKASDVVASADGSYISGLTVSSLGRVTLGEQHSYVIIGLPYTGIFESMDIEAGGDNGVASTKQKSVTSVGVRFLDTAAARIGTRLYKTTPGIFRSTDDDTDRPPPLFSGIKEIPINDRAGAEKRIYVVQDRPMPCNIQVLAPRLTTNDG